MKNPGRLWHSNRIMQLAKLQATGNDYPRYTAMLDEEKIAAKEAGISDYAVQRLQESAEFENPVKFGTLRDFNNAKKLLVQAGLPVTVYKSPNDLIRKLMVGKEEAVSISRIGRGWVFRYNKNFWGEANPKKSRRPIRIVHPYPVRFKKNPSTQTVGNTIGGLGLLSVPLFIGFIIWAGKKYGS